MPASGPKAGRWPGRVQYVKVHGDVRRFVIYDRSADGTETFADQEPFEVCWFEFTPSADELRAARWLLASGRGAAGWGESLEAVLKELNGPGDRRAGKPRVDRPGWPASAAVVVPAARSGTGKPGCRNSACVVDTPAGRGCNRRS